MTSGKKSNEGNLEVGSIIVNEFLIEKVDENTTYYGESATPKTPQNSDNWLIVKFSFVDGELVSCKFADGSKKFDKKWSERATYSY